MRQQLRVLFGSTVLKRWLHSIPFLLSLASLSFMIWSGISLATFPFIGVAINYPSGNITYIDLVRQKTDLIKEGDTVVMIDQIPIDQVSPIFNSKKAGDLVKLDLKRGDEYFRLSLLLEDPPFDEVLFRLTPLFVSFVLWLVSVSVFALGSEDKVAKLFFIFGQIFAATISAGAISWSGPSWVSSLFNFLIWYIGPLFVHLHLYFPRPLMVKNKIILLGILYFIATLGGLPYLIWGRVSIGANSWLPFLKFFVLIFLALNIFMVIFQLYRNHRIAKMQQTKGKIRIVFLGGVFSLLPVTILYLLPNLLFGQSIISIPISFMFFCIVPITYFYAIVRHRLIRITDQVSRGATQLLIYTLVVGFYVVVIAALLDKFRIEISASPIFLTFFVVFLASMFNPLRSLFKSLIERVFYGRVYNYRAVVFSTQELSQSPDVDRLSEQLIAIVRSMRFPSAALLWPEDNHFQLSEFSYGVNNLPPESNQLPVQGELAKFLVTSNRPCWREDVMANIGVPSLQATESDLLDWQMARLWIPFVSRSRLRGFLVLGSHFGPEWMSPKDLEILATLAALAGVAAENVELLERIRTQLSYAEQARAELEESQRRLAEGREAERLHLARELHDGPIQDLYAIHLQLGDSDIVGIPSSFDGVTNRLLQVIHDLRDICTKLRPPALAYFGLEAAIQSLANSFRKTHPEIDVDVEIKCNGNNRSPQLELALFRIYQEALSNVSQHAGASQVKIRLHDNEEQLLLEIIDDGHGFEVPDRWIQLARKGHLGLLGASERAESIGGTLQISSGEESGTRLSVLTPHFV